MFKFIISFLIFFSSNIIAQVDCKNQFKVLSTGSISSTAEISKYQESIKKASFESYRNKTKTQTLEFDNGFKIELPSAQQLFITGCNINPSDYTDNKIELPIFSVTKEGWILAGYKNQNQNNPKYKN